jgi:hypothetical protein
MHRYILKPVRSDLGLGFSPFRSYVGKVFVLAMGGQGVAL